MNKNVFMGGVLLALVLLISSTVFAVAPTTTTIPTQEWDGSYPWKLDLNAYFTDPESGAMTYSYTRTDTNADVTVSITDNLAVFTVGDEDWTGSNTVTFTALDSESLSVTSNEVILKREQPAYCDLSDGTKVKIGDIDFDDDKYKIGDTVKVDIENVEANIEDLEDVTVEVCVYNIDESQEIDCWEADDTYNIDEDDEEDYTVEFTIPNSEDIGEKDNYKLIVVVTADDEDGDNQCIQESDDLEIERETHDVIITSFRLIPTTVNSGETVQATVDVENIGTKSEDDVYVVLRDSILGIDLESNRFDLDDYTDSDNDNTVRFTFSVPSTAKTGDYVLEPVVYFDDGDETNSGDFATLKVKEGSSTGGNGNPTTASISLSTDTTIESSAESTNLHFIIRNSGSNDLTGTLSLVTIGSWANSIVGQPISLHTGDNNIYLPLSLKDVQAGMNSATVTIRPAGSSSFDEKQFTLNFDVKESESDEGVVSGSFSFLEGKGTVFWIVIDLVLIVVAVLFIRAVFGKKTSL